MTKVYKSSKAKVFFSWVISAVTIFFVAAMAVAMPMMWMNAHRNTLLGAFPFIAVFSLALATYLAYYRWNITVLVSASDVAFMRGKTSYLRFSFAEHRFSSLLNVTTNGLFKSNARFLQMFPEGAKYGKNHKLHNFSHKTFEACMASIHAIGFQDDLAQEVLITDEDGNEIQERISMDEFFTKSMDDLQMHPRVFTLNKQAYLKRTKAHFRSVTLPFAITIALLAFFMLILPFLTQNQFAIDHMMTSVTYLLFLTAIFTIFPVLFGLIPYRHAKNTVEKITLYHDRVILDGKTFLFRDTSQIRMTTPSTGGGAVFRRTITITQNDQSTSYALGDDLDRIQIRRKKQTVPIFEDYETFYSILSNIFAFRAAKEGGTSIFVSDVK